MQEKTRQLLESMIYSNEESIKFRKADRDILQGKIDKINEQINEFEQENTIYRTDLNS